MVTHKNRVGSHTKIGTHPPGPSTGSTWVEKNQGPKLTETESRPWNNLPVRNQTRTMALVKAYSKWKLSPNRRIPDNGAHMTANVQA